MSKEFAVYGLGNGIMDLQLSVDDNEFSRLGLRRGSMNLVDTKEQADLLSRFKGHEVHQASGGSAANTIIALAQLGGKAVYGCLLGDDSFGKFYADEMQKLGVELYTRAVAGATTGSSVILITPDAERTMNTHLGVSAELSAEHVSSRYVKESEWIYLEGYLFSAPGGRAAIRQALKYASKSGTRAALTFSDTFIVNGFREALSEALNQCELVFANLSEAAVFVEENDEEKVFEKLKNVAPNVIMTMSERGVKLRFDGLDYSLPAYETQAVDDTGAGDMFAGGFLYGIAHGLGAEDSARLAAYLASRVVSQLGPRLSGDLLNEAEVKRLLAL